MEFGLSVSLFSVFFTVILPNFIACQFFQAHLNGSFVSVNNSVPSKRLVPLALVKSRHPYAAAAGSGSSGEDPQVTSTEWWLPNPAFAHLFSDGNEPFHDVHILNQPSLARFRRTTDAGDDGGSEFELPDSAMTFARQDGDFVLGGMFAVNIRGGDGALCGRVLSPAGMWVESMMYAVDVINNSTETLPHHKLGFEIRNDCSDPNRALTEALNFVESSQPSTECPSAESQTIGVVGTGSSSTSIGLATLLGLFSIPQVSYSASSRILSDKQQYPYFLRTVPSDENQARVMADLAEVMRWNYVAILYSANSYGVPGKNALQDNLTSRNVCVVQEYFIGSESAASTSLQEVIANLKADAKIEVIFTFMSKTDINSALIEARTQGLTGRTWIASDSWGDSMAVVSGFEPIVQGMIGIVPKASIDPNLKGYLASLDPSANTRNPWYQLTLGARHGCTFDPTEAKDERVPVCHGNETFADMLDTRSEGAWSSFIIDAVHSLAYGLHNMLYECQGPSCVNSTTSAINTDEFFQYVRNVTFNGLTNPSFRFDENGDPMAQYFIFNLQDVDGEYVFKEVGVWDPNQKFTLTGDVVWPNGGVEPVSRCSADCPPGSYLIRQSVTCCWDCAKCEKGHISAGNNSESCSPCQDGERTDEAQTTCVVKPVQYLQWMDPFSIAISILAVVAFVGVIFCFGIYVRYRHTPTIKATSTELSYILLTAIVMTLICSFLYLAKPTDLMCNLQISVLGCSFALYVATLLTKTNRISRIFNRKLSDGRPSMFLNIKYQVMFVLVIVLVQACLQILLIQLFPPRAVYDFSSPDVTNLVCQNSILSSILAFIYNLLLALLCSFQAFRIRKLPGQFNDSRGICFSMLTFSLLAFIFIATTFTTAGRTKSMISALACLACGFSGIMCMFAPKIWIVLFRPERNIRQSTLRIPGLSSTLNTVSASGSGDRYRGRRNAVFEVSSNGAPGSRLPGRSSSYHADSDHDSGASSASDDEDTDAIDAFLEELGRLERELREAERVRDEAVSKADEMYEQLHEIEKQHKQELVQLTQDYEQERDRIKETLVETGVEEHQLQRLEDTAQQGARQAIHDKLKADRRSCGVQFADFTEHLAQMNIERNQLRHQVDELTMECNHWKEKVLESAKITSEELDSLGANGEAGSSVVREKSDRDAGDEEEEEEETSSKADSGVV
ncbi:metabotropic glutamate receptor 3-like [Diadema antillarum]|uniref:metabotropic glutamate receptor 3-like n=1 Tax=Diadema antillarum TaxID=105358 RepID=UPI003A8A7200